MQEKREIEFAAANAYLNIAGGLNPKSNQPQFGAVSRMLINVSQVSATTAVQV